MRSRRYTKIIEIWQTTPVEDGYGGSLPNEEVLITKSWCNIKNKTNTQRLTDLGVTDVNNTIVIQLRHRNDINYNAINQYIKYRGVKYIIQNAPNNVDFQDVDIEIIATRENVKTADVIEPIPPIQIPVGFPYTLPFKLA